MSWHIMRNALTYSMRKKTPTGDEATVKRLLYTTVRSTCRLCSWPKKKSHFILYDPRVWRIPSLAGVRSGNGGGHHPYYCTILVFYSMFDSVPWLVILTVCSNSNNKLYSECSAERLEEALPVHHRTSTGSQWFWISGGAYCIREVGEHLDEGTLRTVFARFHEQVLLNLVGLKNYSRTVDTLGISTYSGICIQEIPNGPKTDNLRSKRRTQNRMLNYLVAGHGNSTALKEICPNNSSRGRYCPLLGPVARNVLQVPASWPLLISDLHSHLSQTKKMHEIRPDGGGRCFFFQALGVLLYSTS